MDGVKSIAREREIIKIFCERDLSSAIAKTIVESGVELNCLVKREYGLDDIYQRYFEKEEVK
jgi:ABC-2 type transport system ATP-binding protein